MSSKHISRQLLRRQLLQPIQKQVQHCRAQKCVGGVRWYAADGKDEKESFRGQMYQSTHERVQREQADQQRFAEHREAQKSGGSFAIVVPAGELR